MDPEGLDRRFSHKDRLFPPEPSPLVVELVSTFEPGRALEPGAG